MRPGYVLAALTLLAALDGNAQSAFISPLLARGYSVLPLPQSVHLLPQDFAFDRTWEIALPDGFAAGDVSVQTLQQELDERFHFKLASQGSGERKLRLALRPGAITIGNALDTNRAAPTDQAYRLDLAPQEITITANAPPGLLYGVFTFLQLIKPQAGLFLLPQGTITDWPDLELRHIYWDDAHHLEKMSEFKRIIRQAAFFKVNGIALKLEGHFQFHSAPALVDPYALSPAEYQELTGYALRYYVQLIPYLDSPGHIAFILKHPEYANLRAFPDNNYELCATNPGSYNLLNGMLQDLLDANRGVQYFYLSTDEAYYIGMADTEQCREAVRARELGSPGKLLADFLAKTAGYLHQRGRTVMFWGEYPLTLADIPSLPPYLVNGEVYGGAFDQAYKARGIRQMIYTASAGEEKLFPNYFTMSGTQLVAENLDKISFDPSRTQSYLMGVVNAGWGDMGLHPETFWLGYAAASAAGWHPAAQSASEVMAVFYRQFHGPTAISMGRIYQLLTRQAQMWTETWDTIDSSQRKPIWGNSEKIFQPKQPAHDQTIPLPPTDLGSRSRWAAENAGRLRVGATALAENDELLGLLYDNLQHSLWNRYSLEVFITIAQLCRENLEFMESLRQMDSFIESARASIAQQESKAAVARLDDVLELVSRTRNHRNRVLQATTDVWYQSWQPRTLRANGRTFLHEEDDVKDHLPDRTIDMSYLIYRELVLNVGDWIARIQASRNQLAASNGLPLRTLSIDWSDTNAHALP